MKYIRIYPTIGCGKEINYSRKDSYKNAENKNCICAKCNRVKRGAVYSKCLNNTIIDSVLSIYYDKKKALTVDDIPEKDKKEMIKLLEEQMQEAASLLDFEQAAKIRDQIKELGS